MTDSTPFAAARQPTVGWVVRPTCLFNSGCIGANEQVGWQPTLQLLHPCTSFCELGSSPLPYGRVSYRRLLACTIRDYEAGRMPAIRLQDDLALYY